MYSHYPHLNLLTQFICHICKHVVVCPGSRNAPLIHNMQQCDNLTLHPISDERSAAFYALGMAIALQQPVAICVTSGSAVANLAPAFSEAYYRRCPIIALSADRPHRWINQNEGQTIRQIGTLKNFVCAEHNLSPILQEADYKYTERLLQEAVLEMNYRKQPIHINIEIDEPLYCFDTPSLPLLHTLTYHPRKTSDNTLHLILKRIAEAERPMLIVGQTNSPLPSLWTEKISDACAIFYEPLSVNAPALQVPSSIYEELPTPDFVIYMGGHIVDKSFRRFIRSTPEEVEMWHVAPYAEVCDTFLHETNLFEADVEETLTYLSRHMAELPTKEYARRWNNRIKSIPLHHDGTFILTHEKAIELFERNIERNKCIVHYGNSRSIRYACKYAQGYVYVNRGVNGIDGSTSTAAGHALVTEKKVYLICGDLSFFYDQNALWNTQLKSNLRILLLNNGGGDIFSTIPGLTPTAEHMRDIWATHSTQAKGACTQYNIDYLSAHNLQEYNQQLRHFLLSDSERPILLEVTTPLTSQDHEKLD